MRVSTAAAAVVTTTLWHIVGIEWRKAKLNKVPPMQIASAAQVSKETFGDGRQR